VFGAGGRAGGPKAAGAGQNAKRRPIRLGFADPRLRETASAALCHVRIPTARPFQLCSGAQAPMHCDLARPCHFCTATWLDICTATRLVPATSAPRLGSPLAPSPCKRRPKQSWV
jgi:hypothetical protein